MYCKILLATDGSPHAQKAAEYVRNLVKLKPTAQVTVVYVKHYNRELHMNRGISVELPIDEAVIASEAREAILNKARDIIAEAAQKVETKVLFGNAAEEVAALAEGEGHDLIVMGSRGLNELKGLLLGSVSERVLHLAKCSVLIVK